MIFFLQKEIYYKQLTIRSNLCLSKFLKSYIKIPYALIYKLTINWWKPLTHLGLWLVCVLGNFHNKKYRQKIRDTLKKSEIILGENFRMRLFYYNSRALSSLHTKTQANEEMDWHRSESEVHRIRNTYDPSSRRVLK